MLHHSNVGYVKQLTSSPSDKSRCWFNIYEAFAFCITL